MADKILNTGLDALLGDVATPNKQTIKEIELNQIKPNRFQPRQSFDEQKINELSQSIAKHGILSPILVRETGAGGYELIAGERRLRAAKQAGLQKAPCMVDSAEDQLSLELALIENLQREDLNPIEEARGYDRLKREFSLTQDKIAEVTGKARSSVANSMRLLNLPTSVINLLYSGDLEKGHAKILASMDPKEAEELAQKIVSLGMTVKDAATSTKPTPTNPARGGRPIRLTRTTAVATTIPGLTRINPAYDEISSLFKRFRRRATIPNAPRFIKRYVAR